jgi:ketopantoate reductase
LQLARAGVEVSLVARGAHLAAMRANGLKLLIGDEERVVQLALVAPRAKIAGLYGMSPPVEVKSRVFA